MECYIDNKLIENLTLDNKMTAVGHQVIILDTQFKDSEYPSWYVKCPKGIFEVVAIEQVVSYAVTGFSTGLKNTVQVYLKSVKNGKD